MGRVTQGRAIWLAVAMSAPLWACECASSPASRDGGFDGGFDAGARDGGAVDGGASDDAGDGGVPTDALASDAGWYEAWTDCGSAGGTPMDDEVLACICSGVNACDAVAGVLFAGLGSQRFRVCGRDGLGRCVISAFTETEGGGAGQRCPIPADTAVCTSSINFGDIAAYCEETFTCNLLMSSCPMELTPCT